MTGSLACHGLVVRRGRREILRGVDLALPADQLTVLLGPNGAGKSTLLAVLAGLLAPTAGSIERHGRVAAALQAPALASRTALANVELALRWWGRPAGRSQRRQRAGQALELLNAGHLAGRQASTLSGGEARRVHLARALAVRPDVLILDEPFAGLDPSVRADLLYDATTAFRAAGRAVLVVVHDRAEAWALADRVLIMMDGRLVADGTPTELFEHPPTEQVSDFVGFTGRVRTAGGCIRLRARDVVLDAGGPLRGTVRRRIPLEDGVRLEIDVPDGRVEADAPIPGPAVGADVGLRLRGGVRFTGSGFGPDSPAP